jgi:hypothetical protein
MSTFAIAGLLVSLLTPLPWQQATPAPNRAGTAETAAQFYLRYRSAALNATSVDEITPFWTTETVDEFNMEPASARAETLPMMKRAYGRQTDVKVVRETATPTGATLFLEGLDSAKQPVVSTIDIVRENGAWKIGAAVEQWQSKRTPIPDQRSWTGAPKMVPAISSLSHPRFGPSR